MSTIRAATRDDIPALAELARRCDLSQRSWAGPDIPIPSIEESALEWELRFARRGAWIRLLQDGGPPVGVVAYANATVTREDPTPVAGLAHVSAVFVDPACWRQGIARRLLTDAEAAMRAQGYRREQLWTLAGSPAEQLYAALGWRPDGRRDLYPPLGLDVVAYVKTL